MYSTSFSFDAHTLWRQRNHHTPRVHEDMSIHGQNQRPNGPYIHGNGQNHTTSMASQATGSNRLFSPQNHLHNLPADVSHYAPPLSAYLTEECGPSGVYTEYNMAKQLALVSGSTDMPLLSPMLLKRLQTLKKIRTTGYNLIVPIGIGKTMAQLDAEAQMNDDDSHCVQENLVHGTTNAEALAVMDANVNPNQEPGTTDNVLGMDRDLDAQVVDADASDTFDEDFDNHVESLGHDGFMAEDVEYQNDHSLGMVSASTERSRVVSGNSFVSHLILTGSTPATTLSGNVLACDDSDMDMAIEE